MGAAASLESRLLGKSTDKCGMNTFRKRQDAVIFQKNHGFFFYFGCHPVVCLPVKYSICLLMIRIVKDHFQDALDCLIQNGFRQTAILDGFCDLTVGST